MLLPLFMAVDTRVWIGECQRTATVLPRPSACSRPWRCGAAAGNLERDVPFSLALTDVVLPRSTDGQHVTPIQNSPPRLIHIQIHRGHIFGTSLRISRTHPSVPFRTRAPEFLVSILAGVNRRRVRVSRGWPVWATLCSLFLSSLLRHDLVMLIGSFFSPLLHSCHRNVGFFVGARRRSHWSRGRATPGCSPLLLSASAHPG